MASDSRLRQVARIILDAFDVDIQLYIGSALRRLGEDPQAKPLVQWARSHPLQFGAFIRVMSVLAQRLPKDRNLLLQTVVDQLQRLPAEIHRAVYPPASPTQAHSVTRDDSFYARYAEAVEDLAAFDLQSVMAFDEETLTRWVNSHPRVRLFVLQEWAERNIPGGPFDTEAEAIRARDSIPSSRLKWEGDALIREGRKREAFEKFQLAMELSTVTANTFPFWILGNLWILDDPEIVAFFEREGYKQVLEDARGKRAKEAKSRSTQP